MEALINRKSIDTLLKNEVFCNKTQEQLSKLYEYANIVMNNNSKKKALFTTRKTFDTKEFQEQIESIDSQRTSKHNAAMASLSILNNLAEKLDIDSVYEGEIDEFYRGEVARAIFEFCKECLDFDEEHGVKHSVK